MPRLPVIAVGFEHCSMVMNFFLAVTALGKPPLDVTLREIRVQCCLRPDAAMAERPRVLAAGRDTTWATAAPTWR